jgi:hypothetical protein
MFRAAAIVAGTVGLAAVVLAAPVDAQSTPERSTVTEAKAGPKRSCHGERATIVGGKRANVLVGTPRRDIIWAGRGADTVLARGGNDIVCGSRGADALVGAKGRDRLYGQAGRDYCSGERREHRHHYQCEVHLNGLGGRVDPPSARRSQPAVAAEPVAAPDGLVQRRAGHYFSLDSPVCVTEPAGSAIAAIRLGNVYFESARSGRIAILPIYWRLGSGGFTNPGPVQDSWRYFDAPADGQVYSAHLGSTQAYTDNLRVIMGYSVWYWDNAQGWVDGATYSAPHHYANVGGNQYYSGGFCPVSL